MWPHPALAILDVTAGIPTPAEKNLVKNVKHQSRVCMYYVDISELFWCLFWCLSQHNGRRLFQSKYLQYPLTGTL